MDANQGSTPRLHEAPDGTHKTGLGADNPEAPAHVSNDPEHAIPKDLPRPGVVSIVILTIILVGLLALLYWVGLQPHTAAKELIESDAVQQQSDVPVVGVSHPRTAPATKDLVLPCDIRPNQTADLYPRSGGYLKKLYVDIQDQVKEGQLLAEIDAPEVDAQLEQSKAALAQAKAAVLKSQTDVDLGKRTLERYEVAMKESKGAISVQDFDEKKSAFDQANAALIQAQANVAAAEADVRRVAVQQNFQKVTAPFSGIITARNYDVGALLTSNGPGAGKPMFQLNQVDTLRVYVNVPQVYSTDIVLGQPVSLTVRNFANREFKGVVARTAGALDTATRSLPIELDFPNADGKLFPGMYGEIKLTVAQKASVLIIPTSALIFNANGVQVCTVHGQNAHFQKVSVGRDLGNELEITDGVTPADLVIVNPGERLAEGGEVQAKLIVATTQPSATTKPATRPSDSAK